MEIEQINGELVYLVDGRWEQGSESSDAVKFGMRASDLKRYGLRGQGSAIAQFYKIVGDGLIVARHIFKGLNRPLYCDECEDGDQDKLIYTWKPSIDWFWHGDGPTGSPKRVKAPADKVFFVIISVNKNHKDAYPDVYGWIERWNWVREDEALPEAPTEWVERFDCKIYTRKG